MTTEPSHPLPKHSVRPKSDSTHSVNQVTGGSQPWLNGELKQQDMAFIAGGYRCGTTSLFSYLSGHPEINPSIIKEPAFFFSLRHNESPQTSYPQGHEVWAYRSLFRRNGARVLLDGTSNYLNDPGCAQRIAHAVPNAKIVLLLRDPIARLESWYRFLCYQGQLSQQMSIDQWIELQLNDKRPTNDRPYPLQAVAHCLYASYVKAYFDALGNEHVLPLWFDDFKADPRGTTAGVCRFLGLDPDTLQNQSFVQENASSKIRYPRVLARYRKSSRLFIRLLQPWPQRQFNFKVWLFGQFEPTLLRWLTQASEKPSISPPLVAQLREHFADDEVRLSKIIQSAPPWRPDLVSTAE